MAKICLLTLTGPHTNLRFSDSARNVSYPFDMTSHESDKKRLNEKTKVHRDLGEHIVPCNNTSLPAAPNFSLEERSEGGRADVAKRQACHDGAVSARVVHSLQN